jgi:hypothetical protein
MVLIIGLGQRSRIRGGLVVEDGGTASAGPLRWVGRRCELLDHLPVDLYRMKRPTPPGAATAELAVTRSRPAADGQPPRHPPR